MGRTPSGPRPRSVTEHDGLVDVLATGAPALAGFRLTEAGLEAMAGAEYPQAAGGGLTLEDAAAGLTVDGRPGLRDEILAAGRGCCTRLTRTPARWSVGRSALIGRLASIGICSAWCFGGTPLRG